MPEFPEINCHSYESEKFYEKCRRRPNYGDYFCNSTLYVFQPILKHREGWKDIFLFFVFLQK